MECWREPSVEEGSKGGSYVARGNGRGPERDVEGCLPVGISSYDFRGRGGFFFSFFTECALLASRVYR